VMGQALSGFLQNAQRDRLLNDALTFVRETVEAHRSQLSSLIADRLPLARILNLVGLDEKVAGKLVDWVLSLLGDMRDDTNDPFRQQLIERLEAAAQWLMHSDQAVQREADLKDKLFSYEVLLQLINDSWDSVKQWLLADLRHERSEFRIYLDAALAGLG